MSSVNKSKILKHMKLLGFKLVDQGKINCWVKSYGQDCKIKVDLKTGWVNYPRELKVHHQSTSKLLSAEDYVVLECVDRLLRKGYPAKKIELEKTWKVGRNESGRLDILVRRQNDDDIYLMIECKTYNTYDGALNLMKTKGGQLFSYLQQDQSAEFLCLYASWVYPLRMRYKYSAVKIDQSIRDSKNMDEMIKNWDKKCTTCRDMVDDRIFGKNASPYEINFN